MSSNYKIETFTGGVLNFSAPPTSTVTIEDVAHGLSNVCRFGGQCIRFYSVAEHSVRVADKMSRGIELIGLLHDASEAFMGDIPRPVKKMLTTYDAIEKQVQAEMYQRFMGFQPDKSCQLLLDIVDNRLLVTEASQLLHNYGSEVWEKFRDIEPYDINLKYPWLPLDAEAEFLEMYRRLKP